MKTIKELKARILYLEGDLAEVESIKNLPTERWRMAALDSWFNRGQRVNYQNLQQSQLAGNNGLMGVGMSPEQVKHLKPL